MATYCIVYMTVVHSANYALILVHISAPWTEREQSPRCLSERSFFYSSQVHNLQKCLHIWMHDRCVGERCNLKTTKKLPYTASLSIGTDLPDEGQLDRNVVKWKNVPTERKTVCGSSSIVFTVHRCNRTQRNSLSVPSFRKYNMLNHIWSCLLLISNQNTLTKPTMVNCSADHQTASGCCRRLFTLCRT